MESATRNASKYFQPPCAALTHFPATDGSSQMLSIPSLKQDSEGSLLGGPCQHSTDDHMPLQGTFFLQSSSNESLPLFLPSRTALASQTCEVGHIYYFKFSSSHIKKKKKTKKKQVLIFTYNFLDPVYQKYCPFNTQITKLMFYFGASLRSQLVRNPLAGDPG